MANSKLILIEGVPGSGKTSTARFVRAWLEQHGQPAVLFQEGDWNHPADFESAACLDESEYARLVAQFPEQSDFLAEHARKVGDDWMFSYRKMQHEHGAALPETLFKALAQFEVYELPLEKHQNLLLKRWQAFAAQAETQNVIYIFECCFLQNPTTTLLARYNLALEAIQKHLAQLAQITAPLQPRLVYLEQVDICATLENMRQQRPQTWTEYVTWYLTEQAYGQKHALNGFNGVIDFYIIQQALELEFLQTLPIPSLVVSDVTNWETRYKYLESFLEI